MGRAAFFLCAFIFAGCARPTASKRKDQPRPTWEEFSAQIRYPYKATAQRRGQIEYAARRLKMGATEDDLLALLDTPDYKDPSLHWDPHTKRMIAPTEVWYYVHTLEWDPMEPGYRGKLFMVSLTNRTTPRRVIRVEARELDRRRP